MLVTESGEMKDELTLLLVTRSILHYDLTIRCTSLCECFPCLIHDINPIIKSVPEVEVYAICLNLRQTGKGFLDSLDSGLNVSDSLL
jgi:hypothetical protein